MRIPPPLWFVRPCRLALLVAVAGCASGGGATVRDPAVVSVQMGDGTVVDVRRGAEVRADQPVTVSHDRAWAALPAVYGALGLTPDLQEPAAERLGVSRHRFSRRILNRPTSDFFDCGLDPGLNRPLADQVPIEAQVTTQVLAAGAGARLRTTVTGTARQTGGNAGTATCRSTGLLELLIAQMVERVPAA
jgi:hypothetical protein